MCLFAVIACGFEHFLGVMPESMRFYVALDVRIYAFPGLAGQMGLRRAVEVPFEHFLDLLAKWLSGGFWMLILSISGVCWPHGSQGLSGGPF